MSEQGAASSEQERRARFGRILLLAACCSLLALSSWFLFFFFRDDFSTHYPLKVLSAQAFRSFEIPWWNFHSGGGQPLAGNPNALTFYPDNILYLLLPAHVAFNLHFLLHLAGGFFAMRALTRSNFGGALWALSGVAASATAFYNLVTAVTLIPLALLGAERRSWRLTGAALGLLALAGEPVTLLATTIAVAIVWGQTFLSGPRRQECLRHTAFAVLLAIVIASPQLIAYSEIAREVERSHGYSARTVLNASLSPLRLLELIVPIPSHEPRLFLTLFLGVLVVPALFRRSRYVVIAAVMLFFALGVHNPIVRMAVEALPAIRIARFPEKFALPMCAALVVLMSMLPRRRLFAWITFVPLIAVFAYTLPVDLFAPYDVAPVQPRRVFRRAASGGQEPSREEYRRRARDLEPVFGAVAGLRFVVNRSPDGMHSLLSRVAAERAYGGQQVWIRLVRDRPMAINVPRAVAARTIPETVQLIESGAEGIVPWPIPTSAARVTRYEERGQTIEIDVDAPGDALIVVNQSFFNAWVARTGGERLGTTPVDLDRLGVMVPSGRHTIELRFGVRRAWVIAAWIASTLALLAVWIENIWIEKRNRGAREIQRAADEDAALG